MQITPKIQDVRDNSEIILENCTAILRAQDLSSIRNEFSKKEKGRLYTATSKIGAVLEIISLIIAIILLIPLIVFKFSFILTFRYFMR